MIRFIPLFASSSAIDLPIHAEAPVTIAYAFFVLAPYTEQSLNDNRCNDMKCVMLRIFWIHAIIPA